MKAECEGINPDGTPQFDQFFSDEEPENFESQKEDMKIYLNKMNKRIDILVDAWKKSENMLSKMGDYKVLMEQAQKRKDEKARTNGAHDESNKDIANEELKEQPLKKQPITEFLREEIKKFNKWSLF